MPGDSDKPGNLKRGPSPGTIRVVFKFRVAQHERCLRPQTVEAFISTDPWHTGCPLRDWPCPHALHPAHPSTSPANHHQLSQSGLKVPHWYRLSRARFQGWLCVSLSRARRNGVGATPLGSLANTEWQPTVQGARLHGECVEKRDAVTTAAEMPAVISSVVSREMGMMVRNPSSTASKNTSLRFRATSACCVGDRSNYCSASIVHSQIRKPRSFTECTYFNFNQICRCLKRGIRQSSLFVQPCGERWISRM